MDDTPAKPEARRVFVPDGMHLLRTVQQIQYQLSQMADQKASILLGITFVIFTIAIGQARAGGPTLPVMILGGAAFVAAFLTIMAVLPSIKAGPRVDGPRNVLFFSAFTQLPEEEFVSHMLDIVTDTQTIYEAFAHDIYQNGRVLAGKKYKLLGYAYRVLLTGLVGSFIAFVAPYLLKALKL
jgi:hypothetical protein